VIEFPEDMTTAIGHLKATLPLLTKHKLPANPINYGLWYLYASNRSKELQRALDAVIAAQGTCPEHEALSLFRQHLLEEHNGKHQKATGKLHLLTQSLQSALQDTLQTSNQMDRQLNTSRDAVRSARQNSDLTVTVNELLQAIDQLTQHNRDYRRIVQGADGEIDRLKTELNALQRASDIDELTQLYNRAALFREINKHITATDRRSFSLILMDIDHFKSVNDRFGHLMGDRVLQRIGSLLLQQLRTDTIAARFGGEEFAILCPDTNLANAAQLAERLRDQMQRLRIKIRNSETVLDSITASFGIACYRSGDSIDSLFERADKAMYAAKEAGRNSAQLEGD
jgi:diguanylate cyclase